MEYLTLPSFEVVRHTTKGGQKRISVRFPDPDTAPGDELLGVMNAKRGGLGSYSRVPSSSGRRYGWVFPPEVWGDAAHRLGAFALWEPLKGAFEGAMEDWSFEIRTV